MTDTPIPTLYCANHPTVETSLRCRQCDKPICPKCAIRTPTGYKCRECVKGQQQIFNTATSIDYVLAFVTSSILSIIGCLIAQSLGFFTILVAPFVGIVIAEGVRLVTHRHRSRALFNTALAGTIAGCLPSLLLPLVSTIFGLAAGEGLVSLYSSISLIWTVVYAVLACSSMYYRLSGIKFGRYF
jgi:hypothetical protein